MPIPTSSSARARRLQLRVVDDRGSGDRERVSGRRRGSVVPHLAALDLALELFVRDPRLGHNRCCSRSSRVLPALFRSRFPPVGFALAPETEEGDECRGVLPVRRACSPAFPSCLFRLHLPTQRRSVPRRGRANLGISLRSAVCYSVGSQPQPVFTDGYIEFEREPHPQAIGRQTHHRSIRPRAAERPKQTPRDDHGRRQLEQRRAAAQGIGGRRACAERWGVAVWVSP